MDSGIGGLPYFQYIRSVNPDEKFIYAADRENFPYGPKSRETLISLLERLIRLLISLYDPKVIVLACNTASVSALETLRTFFPGIPFIGTVPAVKPAALETRTGIIGVLGTLRTVEDPYIRDLVKKYRNHAVIKGIAAPELVDFVENQYASASPEEKQRTVSKYIDLFRAAGADVVVLGCTHFLFLLEEFRDAASPDIKVYDSIEGISQRLTSILDERQLRASPGEHEKDILIITGGDDAQPVWKQRAETYGMKLLVLDRISAKGVS